MFIVSIVCPICSGRDNREVERHHEYILRHCRTCDVVYADPMKTSESFYSADYDYMLRDRLIMDPVRWDFRWDIGEFLRTPPRRDGNLLDIGCGTGFFVKRAREMGFRGYGIEFNERSVQRGKDFFALDTLYPLDIDGLTRKFPELKFQVVTLFQVLEHVENPRDLFSAIGRIITEDAVVVVALPLRGRWPDTSGKTGDYPPHHLTRWSLKALENFLDRHGFFIRRHKFENFPLQNMPALLYPYLLERARFLTMKGSRTDDSLRDVSEEQAITILTKRKVKMQIATAASFPLWLFLKALGARGPHLYVEACLKP
ncbi:MAG: class I SAM-dependent methyltransferase [Nitrospiraceae bacterium]|nr:class I SAM-dependent methyltransferase [Nitrospiraceae bacterium]